MMRLYAPLDAYDEIRTQSHARSDDTTAAAAEYSVGVDSCQKSRCSQHKRSRCVYIWLCYSKHMRRRTFFNIYDWGCLINNNYGAQIRYTLY